MEGDLWLLNAVPVPDEIMMKDPSDLVTTTNLERKEKLNVEHAGF